MMKVSSVCLDKQEAGMNLMVRRFVRRRANRRLASRQSRSGSNADGTDQSDRLAI